MMITFVQFRLVACRLTVPPVTSIHGMLRHGESYESLGDRKAREWQRRGAVQPGISTS